MNLPPPPNVPFTRRGVWQAHGPLLLMAPLPTYLGPLLVRERAHH